MPTFELIPPLVEAQQLDRDNAEELAEWCGGVLVEEIDPFDSDIRMPGINVPTPDGNVRASYTDYILQFDLGYFEVRKKEKFQQTYRIART